MHLWKNPNLKPDSQVDLDILSQNGEINIEEDGGIENFNWESWKYKEYWWWILGVVEISWW